MIPQTPRAPERRDAARNDPGAARASRRRLRCLFRTLHVERGLSRALVQHLRAELPDIDFTLEEGPAIDVVWLCGFEVGHEDLVRELRERHPTNLLLVTAKVPEGPWTSAVLAAGADSALSWPIDLVRLGEVLRRRPLQRPA